MARTDRHRPSAPAFDPSEYECVGVFDLHPEDGNRRERVAVVAGLVKRGITFAGVHPTGQCDHCGTHIRYEAMMIHTPTRKIVTVGETCLDERFAYGTAADFAAFRAAAAAKAAATRAEHAAHATAAAAAEWLTEGDPVLVELSYAGNGGVVDGDDFLTDLARSLYRNGALTDRQEPWAVKGIRRAMDRNARDDARRAEAAARAAAGIEAPTGRVAITGTIERTWTREGDYGTQFKMSVQVDAGYIVKSTIPAAILAAFGEENPTKNHYAMTRELAGRRVEFTATLTRSDDDAGTAFASRPSKARLIADQPAECAA
jgi:hypothetical protein